MGVRNDTNQSRNRAAPRSHNFPPISQQKVSSLARRTGFGQRLFPDFWLLAIDFWKPPINLFRDRRDDFGVHRRTACFPNGFYGGAR